ncbi:MAG: glycosyltransferase family 4 protein [Candidatus Bathyarchaeota archaeon]
MNRKLNVAVFNTQPPHIYFGGVERRIVENAKLLRKDVNTTIYSGSKKGFNKPSVIDGITFIPCFSTDILYPIDNWFFNRSISELVKVIKTDIYEAHTVSGYKLLKTLEKKKIRKPFIHTIHGVLADEYFQATKSVSPTIRMKLSNLFMWYLAKIEKETAQKAKIIITVSRYSAQKIVQLYGIDRSKIRVVPNGVNLQKFKPNEDDNRIRDIIGNNYEDIVLSVGNLIPRKGFHFLIEAAKNVVKENKKTKFVVVGDGPLRNHLISYSKELDVFENFVFLGEVSEALLHSLYNSANIFVSSSIQEGQGISMLEAQATAKPVVAFNVTAIKEVVKNHETGLLVKPNKNELSKAILFLLSDKVLQRKMGRSGREFVSKNFSWEISAKNMLNVYSEVTKDS